MEGFGLVLYANDGLVFAKRDFRVGDTGLFHHHHNLRPLHSGDGTLDAKVLNGVVGVADASGVNEAESDAAELDGVFDGIARGALNVADDGAFLAEEGVEEGALAHVGGSDNGHGDAVLEGIACLEGAGQMCDVRIYLLCQCQKFWSVGKLQLLVVGEVEFKLQQRSEVQELVAQPREFAGEMALQLGEGNAMGCSAVGSDEVGDSLGLREVELAIEEGTLRKFTGLCQAASMPDKELQDFVQDIAGTVTGELHAVLAGVAGRGAEEGDDGLIEDLVGAGGDGSKNCGARWRGRCQARTYLTGNCESIGTRNADDADGTARSCGYGADCFFQAWG